MLKRRTGFDLIQIGLAAVAIAILTGAVIIGIGDQIEASRRNEAKAVCTQIAGAISRYRYDMEQYPTQADWRTQLTAVGGRGPWLPAVPQDPWGGNYSYVPAVNSFSVSASQGDVSVTSQ